MRYPVFFSGVAKKLLRRIMIKENYSTHESLRAFFFFSLSWCKFFHHYFLQLTSLRLDIFRAVQKKKIERLPAAQFGSCQVEASNSSSSLNLWQRERGAPLPYVYIYGLLGR